MQAVHNLKLTRNDQAVIPQLNPLGGYNYTQQMCALGIVSSMHHVLCSNCMQASAMCLGHMHEHDPTTCVTSPHTKRAKPATVAHAHAWTFLILGAMRNSKHICQTRRRQVGCSAAMVCKPQTHNV